MFKSVLSLARPFPPHLRLIEADVPTGGSDEPEDDGVVTEEELGDEDAGEEPDEPADDEDEDDDEGVEHLRDPGKQALDRMKAKFQAERKRRQALEAKYEPPKDDAADIMARANQKILRSEIRAAAAGKLADPADAYRFLDLAQFEVDDNGDIDEDEIAAAIDDLLANKPYLATQTQRVRRSGASGGGGVRNESTPHQLTEQDLDRMPPEAIEKARAEGRLNKILGISR